MSVEIPMGVQARDVVSGFTGMVIARAEYLYEESQVLVAARTGQGSVDSRWIAERRVEQTDAKAPGFG